MPSGDRYYLVSARDSNLEGPTGYETGGTPRPGHSTGDLCDSIGYGSALDDKDLCAGEFAHAYPDQFNNLWTLDDLRGKTVLLGFEQFG
jgi:hypothetical protein